MSGFAAAAAVIAVVGAGVSGYSMYEQGQNAAALARYNAAQQQAQDQYQLTAAAAKSSAQRAQNAKILAQQEGEFAASGVVTNTGSPLTVESNQAKLLELRALDTDYEGAMAYHTGQTAVTQDEMTGQAAKQAGDLGAAGTILSGVGQAGGNYARAGDAGGGGGGGGGGAGSASSSGNDLF